MPYLSNTELIETAVSRYFRSVLEDGEQRQPIPDLHEHVTDLTVVYPSSLGLCARKQAQQRHGFEPSNPPEFEEEMFKWDAIWRGIDAEALIAEAVTHKLDRCYTVLTQTRHAMHGARGYSDIIILDHESKLIRVFEIKAPISYYEPREHHVLQLLYYMITAKKAVQNHDSYNVTGCIIMQTPKGRKYFNVEPMDSGYVVVNDEDGVPVSGEWNDWHFLHNSRVMAEIAHHFAWLEEPNGDGPILDPLNHWECYKTWASIAPKLYKTPGTAERYAPGETIEMPLLNQNGERVNYFVKPGCTSANCPFFCWGDPSATKKTWPSGVDETDKVNRPTHLFSTDDDNA